MKDGIEYSVIRQVQRVLGRQGTASDSKRAVRAVVLLLLGMSVGTGAAAADIYLHRGIESGAETPYVVHSSGRELAINVDLATFDANQLQQVGSVLAANEYRYVRQPLRWRDVEPSRGVFNWSTFDLIVEVMTRHGVEVVPVLQGVPDWARSPETVGFNDAPPLANDDFVRFAAEAARRYAEVVTHIQIWNLPNRPDHWGGQVASAGDFVRLTAETSNAIRAASPSTMIVLAEMEPAYPSGEIGADLSFLDQLYRAGARPYFDVLAFQMDGGKASPYARGIGAGELSLSRAVLVRELMVRNEDRSKPVWMTHFGWEAGEASGVSQQEQADFFVAGLGRVRDEWPWVGLIFVWALLPDRSGGDAGYAALAADGTANPVFTALSEYARAGEGSVAAPGYVPTDAGIVAETGNWADQTLAGRSYRTTSEVGASITLGFEGTGISALVRIGPQTGPVGATLDGGPIAGWPVENGVSIIDLDAFTAQDFPVSIAEGLTDSRHSLTLTLLDQGQLTIAGLIVSRDPPLLWPVIVLILIAVGMVAAALRDAVYVVAFRTGTLQRRTGLDLRPPLPRLPDFRPSHRY